MARNLALSMTACLIILWDVTVQADSRACIDWSEQELDKAWRISKGELEQIGVSFISDLQPINGLEYRHQSIDGGCMIIPMFSKGDCESSPYAFLFLTREPVSFERFIPFHLKCGSKP
jgi:hypothetical protein